MRRSRLTWVRRAIGTAVAAAAVFAALTWMEASPHPAGIAVLVLALAGLWWFVADFGADFAPTEWTSHTVQTTRRPAADGRVAVLHRTVHDTFDPPQRAGSTAGNAPTTLQEVLRGVAAGRLRRAHATTPDQTDTDVVRRLLTDRDPELTAYLLSVPADRPEPHRLDQILTRIEAL